MTLARPIAPTGVSPIEPDVAALRRMLSIGRHEEALLDARRHLAETPDHRECLLIEASALRHLGQIEESLALLARLESLHPRYSLMHQERGLCHVAKKDAQASLAALLTAVAINPALPLAWRMIEGVYKLIGDAENAATAAAHVATLASLPRDVVTATSLYSDGDLSEAEEIVRRFLLENGDHPEGMRLLARIGIAREVYDDAELLLEGVMSMVPGYRAAQFDYAQALTHRQKFVEAREALAPLLAEAPSSHEFRTLASTIAVGLGRHDEAIELYRGMLADVAAASPGDKMATDQAVADLNLWLGHALKTIGKVAEAIVAYRLSASARPDFGDAYWSLANLKNYRFSDCQIETMERACASGETADVDRVHLHFALGKAFEDAGDFARSWSHYERGNAQRRASSKYRANVLETNTRLQREVCTRTFFAERRGWGAAETDPIFIVGLPRAGSTLIEQILASHPKVEGTQELPNIHRIAQEMQGRDHDLDDPRYPRRLADLSRDEVNALGSRYLAETRPLRSGRRLFIDKMPNNFRHIGLIHLMLPNARIIDARRDPMACCFSNFKQLFARGQEFSYSLEDIARYYRTYLDLMEHWDEALPGRVLRVHYADVVDDLEASVRRILDHCGLDHNPACLAFHETQRSVRTPSSEQVRQPIFRDGLDQWTNYRNWLGPLQQSLGDAVHRYR